MLGVSLFASSCKDRLMFRGAFVQGGSLNCFLGEMVGRGSGKEDMICCSLK